MNKTISLIAIVTGLALASCGSLQTISFEQLQAADISFPDVVRNVAVVNNMPVYKAGDSHDVISVELKGDGKIAAEALAEEIGCRFGCRFNILLRPIGYPDQAGSFIYRYI